jgi:IS5 family transposase
MALTLGLEGIEAIVLRTVNDQPTLWESILPTELLKLPDELARVDALLDYEVFFAAFAGFFDARIGRPSVPVETYLRLMFLKFRYRLGYESLCREVADSISWQRFARIPFGTSVPHPTTLMKITTRCGEVAVAGLNDALLAKAVVNIARTVLRVKAAGVASRTPARDRRRAGGRGRCEQAQAPRRTAAGPGAGRGAPDHRRNRRSCRGQHAGGAGGAAQRPAGAAEGARKDQRTTTAGAR